MGRNRLQNYQKKLTWKIFFSNPYPSKPILYAQQIDNKQFIEIIFIPKKDKGLKYSDSEFRFLRVFLDDFGEINQEQHKASQTTNNCSCPREEKRLRWVHEHESTVVKIIEHHHHGIIEKMGADVDQNGAREGKKIAQQETQHQSRNKSVHVPMCQREYHSRDSHGHMQIAKPLVQHLLQAASEEKLLTHGGHQRHH